MRIHLVDKGCKEIKGEPIGQYCDECKNELVALPWNTQVDIVICNNPGCRLYRRPQGNIEKDFGNNTKKT